MVRGRLWSRSGLAVLVVVLATGSLLAACGGSGGGRQGSQAEVRGPSKSSGSSGSLSTSNATSSEASSGSTLSSGSSGASGAPANSGSSTGGAAQSSNAPAPWDQRIIRTATMTLSVSDVEQALKLARETAATYGGQVLTSSTSSKDGNEVASITIEVRAEEFDAAMNALRGAAVVKRVESENTSSEDVTDQYVDLQSQLRNAQTAEQRYLDLEKQATKLEDVLALEQQITRVRGEIEQTQGRINYLDRRTTYSRIDLQLQPAILMVNKPAPSFDVVHAAHRAWDASIRFVGGALRLGTTVIVFLWWLWILAGLAWLGIIVARARRRRTIAP